MNENYYKGMGICYAIFGGLIMLTTIVICLAIKA